MQQLGRYRINIYQQRGSTAMAIRVIAQRIPSIQELGLPEVIKKFSNSDRGLCLVTGPTGSGKSTTLAAMIQWINERKNKHIMTIEDPIEYLYRHQKCMINQRQVHDDTLSFHEALRRVLRQDPDVILIGEMRDRETTEIALTMGETGHLVFGTLHTNDTVQSITRIVDIFPANAQDQIRIQLSFVLIGIVAQQLLPRKSGKGRVLALEVMAANVPIRNQIRENDLQQMYSTIETGSKEGMFTMNASLLRLYREGIITKETAMNKSTNLKQLLRYLDDKAANLGGALDGFTGGNFAGGGGPGEQQGGTPKNRPKPSGGGSGKGFSG